MAVKNSEQLQIRIDAKTKEEARKILDGLGMDISTAVKIFLRQVINTRSFPCELRDENGLTLKAASILRESAADAMNSPKSYKSAKSLLDDLMKD